MPRYQTKLPPLDPCPVEAALAIIGKRWTVRILHAMTNRGVRLADLRRAMPRARQQVISERLRDLRASGMVERVAVAGAMLYRLTEDGRSLIEALTAVAAWGEQRIAAIS